MTQDVYKYLLVIFVNSTSQKQEFHSQVNKLGSQPTLSS